ncbi:MAG: TrkH family potassium uptake protein [Prolixibacteraceae bacterium]|jgi:trk system potassium uptake protein TrkH|nr:TrkH family potassium uptake protein [Prolixibacteraceae bacterium]
MRGYVIIRQLGLVCLLNGTFLFLSFLISLGYSDGAELALIFSSLIAIFFGVTPYIFIPKIDDISNHEGLAIVVLGWMLSCVIGIVPYVLYGGEFTLANAVFESVSGFTTTGSTILNEIQTLPKGILFWRSSTHWLGGIGIIIFVLAILPQSGQTKLVLYSNEVSPLAKEDLRYTTKKSIRVILVVYMVLTLAEVLLLMMCGMGWFDAVNHSFATIATGGFSTKNLSVSYFDSVSIEMVINFFMLISGIHFGLLYMTALGKKSNIFTSKIVRYYLGGMAIAMILVSWKLVADGLYPDWLTALRYSSFQLISVGTTTGFATCDTACWPPFTQVILIFFTLQCACAGSTSGGIKVNRVMILWKGMLNQLKKIQHPRAVSTARIGKMTLSEETISGAITFIVIYLVIIFATTLALTAMDIDLFTSFSASATCMGNVGPGFGNVSSLGNFSSIPDLGKYLLSGNMLLGRLEIFSIFALFSKR